MTTGICDGYCLQYLACFYGSHRGIQGKVYCKICNLYMSGINTPICPCCSTRLIIIDNAPNKPKPNLKPQQNNKAIYKIKFK